MAKTKKEEVIDLKPEKITDEQLKEINLKTTLQIFEKNYSNIFYSFCLTNPIWTTDRI